MPTCGSGQRVSAGVHGERASACETDARVDPIGGAVAVGAQLACHGIRAVLTGGACVAFYTGTYTSKHADFVLQGHVTQRGLDDAMHELGFERRGDCFRELDIV